MVSEYEMTSTMLLALEEARSEGAAAKEHGLTAEANPHQDCDRLPNRAMRDMCSRLHDAWAEGWHEGE